MCVPVKRGSELVRKCPAAQAKYSVDTQDKRLYILAVTRPWKYFILNRKLLFPGRTSDPRDSSESTKPKPLTVRDLPLLGQGSNTWCWDKPHPGRQKDQIPSNLLLTDTPARLPRSAYSARRQRLPVLTAQVAGTSLLLQRQILLFHRSGQPASLGSIPLCPCLQPAHLCACQTTHLPEICQQTTWLCVLSTALASPLAFFKKQCSCQLSRCQMGRRRNRQMR